MGRTLCSKALFALVCFSAACILQARNGEDLEHGPDQITTIEYPDFEAALSSSELSTSITTENVFSSHSGKVSPDGLEDLRTQSVTTWRSLPQTWQASPEITSTWRPPDITFTSTTSTPGQNEVSPAYTEVVPVSTMTVSTSSESVDKFVKNEIATDDLTNSEDTTKEWTAESCLLEEVECLEPVFCTGEGRIDCSPLESQSVETYNVDNTTSLNVSLEEKYIRKIRSAFTNTKLLKNRKRYETSKNSMTQTSEEPLDETPCVMEESLLCSPGLTLGNCRGAGQCKLVNSESENGTYLADWEIAVISVLTLAGLFLVVLLVYVIYGAWRKKKVRPITNRNPRN